MRKSGGYAVFNPKDFRSYLAHQRGKLETEISVPEDVVFTYDSGMLRAAVAETRATQADWYIYSGKLYLGKAGDNNVGIVHAMIGAPAAAMNLEELIAYGARRIFELGLAGAIDTTCEPGDVVLLKGALSDEGTSKHYYKGGTRFNSSSVLTKRLEDSLRVGKVEYSTGDAWTIDAPYRETREKVARYRRMGARVVNMESSAVFAVAQYRGVQVASAQIVSDVVSERKWEPAFHHGAIGSRRQQVLAAVLRVIGNQSGNRTGQQRVS